MSKLTEQHKALLAAALAIAISVPVTAAVVDGDEKGSEAVIDVEPKPEAGQSVKRQPRPHEVDPDLYKAAVAPAKAACPACVDLLSPPVEPGASVTAGGNFPRGSRLVGDAMLTGPADGAFSVSAATCADRGDFTWCQVTATNTSATTLRLTAMVEYEVVP